MRLIPRQLSYEKKTPQPRIQTFRGTVLVVFAVISFIGYTQPKHYLDQEMRIGVLPDGFRKVVNEASEMGLEEEAPILKSEPHLPVQQREKERRWTYTITQMRGLMDMLRKGILKVKSCIGTLPASHTKATKHKNFLVQEMRAGVLPNPKANSVIVAPQHNFEEAASVLMNSADEEETHLPLRGQQNRNRQRKVNTIERMDMWLQVHKIHPSSSKH